ncbi:MAG: glycosyltransferase, partial [Nitrospira sp.]|nr:glycosyltransferase [Nitrospira sp.]
GCVGLLVGVETGDEQVMHSAEGKKGLTVQKLAAIREKTRQLGIRLHFLLIVGLPQETRESIVATYDLIQRYKPDTIGVTIITPYPGTPLYAQGLREGWIDSLEWADYGGHQVPMHTPNLTKEDMESGKRFLEEGFALLQRRQVGGYSAPLEALAKTHYETLLRWAYGMGPMIAQLRETLSSGSVLRSEEGSAARSLRPYAGEAASVGRPEGDSALRLSVVMPTYNRDAILRKTLLAFASQTATPDLFEVIVVDDGSSDDTLQMLNRFKAPFALRVLTQQHQGANAARNLAIREARGPLVLITGDDMIPEPAFVEAHLKFHATHPDQSDAMLGFINWSPEITVTPFMRFLVSPDGGQQFSFHLAQNGQADFRLFYTSNISLKRSLLLNQPIMFDPDFTYPAYDDTELGFRLALAGMKIHYNARATTNHHHEMTVQTVAKRQRHAGRMAMVLVNKHPDITQIMQLGIDDVMKAPGVYTEENLESILASLAELEKPSLDILKRIPVNGSTYDAFYTTHMLHPLYHALLRTAHGLGIRDAMQQACEVRKPDQAADQRLKNHKVSIIIPVWNKAALTEQCLKALAETTDGIDYEVILVDNHSTDGTPELLRQLSGDVRIISNKENLGFAKACNQGARIANSPYLLFLNNDTVSQAGWLQPLLEELDRHPEVGIVGSKLLFADGTIQHAGVVMSRFGVRPYHAYRLAPADLPAVNRRREYHVVTGACLLIRRSLFEEAGGFHEGFRNGFEDVDLCLKVREKGHHVVYQPRSVLYHLESQTPGRKQYDDDNARLLHERWKGHGWFGDEDAQYYDDGYKLVTVVDEDKIVQRLRPFADEQDRLAWGLVAEAQRAAARGDLQGLERQLTLSEEWPADRGVLEWGALVSVSLARKELAAAFMRRRRALDDPAVEQIGSIRQALAKGETAVAASQLEQCLRNHPGNSDALILRGVLSMQREQFREAEAAFSDALRQGADRRKCLMGMGMASLGRAYAQGAWETFLQVLSEHPDDAEAIHWLLRAGTAQNRWKDLSDHIRAYVSRNPGDLSARFALAGVLVRADEIESARNEHDAIRVLEPEYDGLSELEKAISGKEAVLAADAAQQ